MFFVINFKTFYCSVTVVLFKRTEDGPNKVDSEKDENLKIQYEIQNSYENLSDLDLDTALGTADIDSSEASNEANLDQNEPRTENLAQNEQRTENLDQNEPMNEGLDQNETKDENLDQHQLNFVNFSDQDEDHSDQNYSTSTDIDEGNISDLSFRDEENVSETSKSDGNLSSDEENPSDEDNLSDCKKHILQQALALEPVVKIVKNPKHIPFSLIGQAFMAM